MEDWLENYWLEKRETSKQEIDNLLRLIERDLTLSADDNANEDYRLIAVHNAAYNCATTALRLKGLRLKRNLPGHHEKAIDSLRYTFELDSEVVEFLNDIRKKRNDAEYFAPDLSSVDEIEDALKIVRQLYHELKDQLVKGHSDLS